MGASASLRELVSPGEWASVYGVQVATVYRLIQTGRMRAVNVSSGARRPTYRLDLEQVPEQPDGCSWDSSAEIPTATRAVW